MEIDPRRHRRRTTLPTSVAIPSKFDTANHRRSPSVPNAHPRNLPPSSDSSTLSDSSDSASFVHCSPMYTSLKDLLPSIPSSLLSPTPTSASSLATTSTSSSVGGCVEICIRNRLVKQAAWAYLQPMSMSMSSSPTGSTSRLTLHSLRRFLSSIKQSLLDLAVRASTCFSDALWLILCR